MCCGVLCVLCCAVLCVLCCAVLCSAVLCCAACAGRDVLRVCCACVLRVLCLSESRTKAIYGTNVERYVTEPMWNVAF